MALRITGRFRPRSRGVRVDRATHGHIRTGDAARARGDWQAAAAAYAAALAGMPALQHIWVQYGHAAKEAGDPATAADAYARAAALAPHDPEPHMYLGHMAKRHGTGLAARHYLDALRRAPEDLAAAGEVMQQLLGKRIADAAMIAEALALFGIDREAISPEPADLDLPAGTIFFDVTDLVGFFGVSRIPTGIQRVQMEIVLAMGGDAAGRTLALCHHSAARGGWSVLPRATFAALCFAARREDDDDGRRWARELRTVFVGCALGEDIVFPPGAILVGLGAAAPSPNYLLDVRTTRARQGLAYIPMVHDLIPEIFPQWFVPNHARDFRLWLASVLPSASGFFANSRATRRDLLAYADAKNTPIAADRVRVVPLDGRPVLVGRVPLPVSRLAKWGLAPRGYVLLVSTIEPRKNHLGAFRAWLALADRIGERHLPKLVCVGGRGWLNDEVHATLARHRLLRRSVKLLAGIGDEELYLLYRHCAFTLYPSLYEGWGLPITESLCEGRLAAVSNTASMPEAGGDFAVYFDPHDPADIAATLAPLMTDRTLVPRAEARIATGFRPRSWTEIGIDIVENAIAIAAAAPSVPVPAQVEPGLRYGLARGGDPDARDGEVYRHGRGWSLPDETGCRVEAPDAMLRFAAPPVAASLRIELKAGECMSTFTVRGGVRTVDGTLAPNERRAVRIALPTSSRGGVLRRMMRLTDATARAIEIEIVAPAEAGLTVEGFAIERA